MIVKVVLLLRVPVFNDTGFVVFHQDGSSVLRFHRIIGKFSGLDLVF